LRVEPIVRFLVRFVFPPSQGGRSGGGDTEGAAAGELEKTRLGGLGAKALASVLWALAAVAATLEKSMLQALAPLLAAELAACVESGELQQEPQAVSTMLWAIASIQKASANLTDALLPHVLEATPAAFDRMTPRQVSIVIWALGALEALADAERRAREKEEEEVRKRRLRFEAGRVSGGDAAALAEREEEVEDVWEEEEKEEESDNLEIKNWAQKFLTKHRATALSAFRSLAITLDDIALATWGLASLEHRDEALMRAATEQADSLVTRCGHKPLAQHLPRILWACARLDCYIYKFMETVANVFEPARRGLRHLGPDAYHALIWSYKKLDKSNMYSNFRYALDRALWGLVKQKRKVRANHIDLDPTEDVSQKLRKEIISIPRIYYLRNQLMFEKAVKLGEMGPDADMMIKRTHQEKEASRLAKQLRIVRNQEKGYSQPMPKLSWFLRQSTNFT